MSTCKYIQVEYHILVSIRIRTIFPQLGSYGQDQILRVEQLFKTLVLYTEVLKAHQLAPPDPLSSDRHGVRMEGIRSYVRFFYILYPRFD